MTFTLADLPPLSLLVLSDSADQAQRDELRAGIRAGRLRPIARGAAAVASAPLSAVDRHILRARASAAVRANPVWFSHLTAATIWGLPLFGDPPDLVHAIADGASGGRSDAVLVRHCTDERIELAVHDGLTTTSLERTVVDVARTADFRQAVMVADAALAGRTRGGVVADPDVMQAMILPGRRGSARARRVLEFADGASGSPGESVSRVSMRLAGLPAPVLQHCFVDEAGRMFVDFWWPRCRVIGEFDGVAKYVRDEFAEGRSIADILLDEKSREDRLRRQGPTVSRWGKSVAASPLRLASLLRAAGVR